MLKLDNISKKYPDFSLRNVCLEVMPDDFFVLLGKSGAGKSLLLEIIAGITVQDTGRIFFKDIDISKKRIQERNFVLVYQDLALFSHFTVYKNIAFALECHKIPKREHKKRISEISSFLGIDSLLDRMPGRLSGGEAQRVALARALVIKPDILLLDEPLSSLDVLMKNELQKLLKNINRQGQTIIQVTHDYEEALALSNKVAIIENGAIIEQGTTDDVFLRPKNSFTASLAGVKNFFKVKMEQCGTDETLKNVIPEGSSLVLKIISDIPEGEGYVAFHSKDVFISLNKTETTAINNFSGTITDIHKKHLGIEVTVDIGIDITVNISRASLESLKLKQGDNVWIGFKASAPYFIPKN